MLSSSTTEQCSLTLVESEDLRGADKWMGGALDPETGTIYGIPGSATHVLRISSSSFLGYVKCESAHHDTDAGTPLNHAALLVRHPLRGPGRKEYYSEAACRKIEARRANERKTKGSTSAIANKSGTSTPTTVETFPTNLHLETCTPPASTAVVASPTKQVSAVDPPPSPRSENSTVASVGDEDAGGNSKSSSPNTAAGERTRASMEFSDDVEERSKRSKTEPVIVSSAIPGNRFKWLRGVYSPTDRSIYGVPCNAREVLRICCDTDRVEALHICSTKGERTSSAKSTSKSHSTWQWHGGCFLDTSRTILAVPCNASRVLQIAPGGEQASAQVCGPDIDAMIRAALDPETTSSATSATGQDEAKTIATTCLSPEVLLTRNKYYGGLVSPKNGAFYCIPFNAPRALRVDAERHDGVENISARLIGNRNLLDLHKWHGGVLCGEGDIYAVPSHANTVLCIEVAKSEEEEDAVLEIAIEGGTFEEASASAGSSTEAVSVAEVDASDHFPLQKPSRRKQTYKYGGGVLGADGFIYCIPSDADRVLQIDPLQKKAKLIGPQLLPGVKNRWQNGFLGSDNCIYCIPCDADCVLKIDTARRQEQDDTAVENTAGENTAGENTAVESTAVENTAVENRQDNHAVQDATTTRASDQISLLPLSGSLLTKKEAQQKEKWEGGTVGLDGAMYCLPQQSKKVLRIAPTCASLKEPRTSQK
ncbi:unnamed protein product [Amoebophrya sp. A25]|nr:unnamed protein product [Amoebophrya sp. A25]|eukprot:GSA25T00026280001.1